MFFSKFKTEIFYVQIRENSFSVRAITTLEEKIVDAKYPYSNQEALVSDFKIIEELLTTTFDALRTSFIKPIAIIHPIDKVGNPLTDRESRLFIELGLSAGARSVKLWLGSELGDEDIREVIMIGKTLS